MSLFDFFFPEEAQASHLRRLADTSSAVERRARVDAVRQDLARTSDRKRIEELEQEVGELTILLEALLEKLDDQNLFTRDELAVKIAEIDLRDGVLDRKITKEKSTAQKGGPVKLNIPER